MLIMRRFDGHTAMFISARTSHDNTFLFDELEILVTYAQRGERAYDIDDIFRRRAFSGDDFGAHAAPTSK